MQFPVPQFTDVEDRIIGNLSFKQFGIVFAAAVITFVFYTITKSVPITIGVGVITGLPALALTFGKLNGRPLYSSAGNFVRFLFGPKIFVFHKQGQTISQNDRATVIVEEQVAPKDRKDTALKIKELNYLLQQQASEETILLERIKENKAANTKT